MKSKKLLWTVDCGLKNYTKGKTNPAY